MSNLLKSLLVAFTSLTLAAGNAYAGEDGKDGFCPGIGNKCDGGKGSDNGDGGDGGNCAGIGNDCSGGDAG